MSKEFHEILSSCQLWIRKLCESREVFRGNFVEFLSLCHFLLNDCETSMKCDKWAGFKPATHDSREVCETCTQHKNMREMKCV